MSKIKVKEILLAKINEKLNPDKPWDNLKDAYMAVRILYDPNPAIYLFTEAIKEIVEKAIDKASNGFYGTEKDVILNAKKEVDYE